jgi:hypothetical protein
MKDIPLYNSRLIKNYVEYLKEHEPEVNINTILDYAGITTYQLEDGGHWFSQRQVDLFHEGMTQQTKDPDIPKNVGRHVPFSKAAGAVSQYALGFITPSVAYSVLGKLHHIFSRHCTIHTRSLGSNKVEVVATPNPGVEEKQYQCENRIGTFESIAKLFTAKFASIEHPTCIHRGGSSCRYIISWKKTPSLLWKTVRNYVALSAFIVCPVLFFILHDTEWLWAAPVLLYIFLVLIFVFYTEHVEKR